MSKVLVDPAALEEAAKWLEVHSSSSGSAEAFAAEALREAIAQPAEAEGVELTGEYHADCNLLLAALSAVTAERDRLQQFEAAYNEWHDKTEWVQETAKAHELGRHRADVLKDRIDQLRAEVETWRAAARWSAVRMSGMLASAQYSMTAETTHEVLELHHHVLAGTPEKIEWLAAMAAKEA